MTRRVGLSRRRSQPGQRRLPGGATLTAALYGRPGVDFPHLLDYLAGFRAGRIKGDAEPTTSSPLPAILYSDADGGIAQLGFDRAMPTFVARAQELGLALFTQGNSYTTGELGDYVRRLALEGLVAFAVSNSPAVVAGAPRGQAVFGTSPLAFAAPLADPGAPLVIDQATSATAFVSLSQAAAEGRQIPEGWAIDERGEVTTDAAAVLRGALLTFGGAKGANLALMVECLAAGLSGAAWSLDMPDFQNGDQPIDAGMTIIAIQPSVIDEGFSSRFTRQLDRIAERGVYVPGRRQVRPHVSEKGQVAIDTVVLEETRHYLAKADDEALRRFRDWFMTESGVSITA
ncbi:Ldh family oxidoreductase [Halomonas sp. KAO]|uniref:Ldh family oxidoreductase n=1 Tax=Halomonas sp. KAO TaxID=2783858 RepID=UPI002B4BA52E|nr:Ldh family oxidoreductase [Halomonas sp. KAO]